MTAEFRGRTRIRGQALHTLAQAVTAEAMHIQHTQVQTALHDRETDLEIEARTPINSKAIERCRNSETNTVYAEMKQVRQRVTERFSALSGMNVSGVNLILTGITTPKEDERRVK
ncbi:MAG: hypothetical protein Q4P06_06005 [Actinomycetaceae bacterium]|nr:hypothetical protein [Actinomycetaceae bacterium]